MKKINKYRNIKPINVCKYCKLRKWTFWHRRPKSIKKIYIYAIMLIMTDDICQVRMTLMRQYIDFQNIENESNPNMRRHFPSINILEGLLSMISCIIKFHQQSNNKPISLFDKALHEVEYKDTTVIVIFLLGHLAKTMMKSTRRKMM